MILLVDVGNTNIVLGIQKEEKYIYGNNLYMYQDYPINRVFVKK